MRITGKLPGMEGYAPAWWDMRLAAHDMFGRLYAINIFRRVTLWRRIRARLGWHESDTLCSGFTNKPKLKNGAVHFDGTQTMRTKKP